MRYFLRGLILLLTVIFTSAVHAETRVCFSPNGACQEKLVSEINKAQTSIDVAMYELTSREVAQALIKAKQRKVKIRITLDSAQIKDHFSKSRYLMTKDVDLKFHMGPGLMHNKFAVIDDQVVLTGSYNWTVSADKKNAENLLIIKDAELAQKFEKQFKILWAQSGEGLSKEAQSTEGK